MKFMVSCRQSLAFLKKASEIKVDYNDIERLRDFITDDWKCEADIIVYISKNQIIDFNQIDIYKDLLSITIALEDAFMIPQIKEKGYPVFWSYPASSFWELNGLLELGVDQILIDAPIFFDLHTVKDLCKDVELRAIVNRCVNQYMPRKNGICGAYIRPEDIETYSDYIQHFEFDVNNDLERERTLYHIYAENKYWPGNLNLLLTGLNENVDNRGFEAVYNDQEDKHYFAHRRIKCGQRCQSKKNCDFCQIYFNLINNIDRNSDKIIKKLDELTNKE